MILSPDLSFIVAHILEVSSYSTYNGAEKRKHAM